MDQPGTTPTPQEAGGLQFDRAEYQTEAGRETEALQCTFCGMPLPSSYFQLNEQMSCEACRYRVEQEHQTRPGAAGFFKAAMAGLGAAIVGCGIYYAVLALSGYEVGLIAILVGYMVGRAVRWGARAKGGWAYQSLAVFLTYMAIVTSYLPLVFKEMAKQEPPAAATQTAAPQATSAPADAPGAATPAVQTASAGAAASSEPSLTAGEFFLGLGALFAFAMALPFLAGFENILGLVIIFFGLWQAWKLNQRTKLEISGPFAVGRVAPPPAAPQG